MKIHDVAQRSPEWHALRLGKPTASEFHKIITPKTGKLSAQARKFACRLIAERLLNEPLDLLDGIEAIERGKAMEPDALAQYEFAEEIETQAVGFVTTDDGLVGASPDRLIVGVSAGLEIKCPLLPTHISYSLDGPGDDYRPQVQGQLWVAELEWIDFYSYHPQMEPVRLRTQRDDAYIKLIEQALRDFNDMLHDMYERVRPAFFAGLLSDAFDTDPILPPVPQCAELALPIAGVGGDGVKTCHLAFVRSLGCVVRNRAWTECRGRIEAHHVRTAANSGIGMKPPDTAAVGLCARHHRTLHSEGRRTFEKTYSVDLNEEARRLVALAADNCRPVP
jgi:hypothetical protein